MELLTDLPPEPPEISNLIHKHRLGIYRRRYAEYRLQNMSEISPASFTSSRCNWCEYTFVVLYMIGNNNMIQQ